MKVLGKSAASPVIATVLIIKQEHCRRQMIQKKLRDEKESFGEFFRHHHMCFDISQCLLEESEHIVWYKTILPILPYSST